MSDPLKPGDVFRVRYPFVLETYDAYPFDQATAWRPGVVYKPTDPYGENVKAVAHAEGWQILTVVSLHKPGPKYPTRVFYTQRFEDPHRRGFGKNKLRIITEYSFRKRIAGFGVMAGDSEGYALEKPDA